MILNVTNNSEEQLVSENDIKYRREHSFVYGVSLEYFVGTSFELSTITVGEKYVLTFNNKEPSEFKLYSVKTELVGEDNFYMMRFIKPIFCDILDNVVPNQKELFSIKFDKYIQSKNNQLSYMLLELRKKSLCLVNDDKSEPQQKHINELLAKPQTIKDGSIYIARELSDYELRFNNFYTITSSQTIVQTTKGKNTHIYLPFATKEDIDGLNNYLIPSYELNTDLTNLQTGDLLELPSGKKIAIIEKDELAFFGTVTTYLVGAIASGELA